MTVLYLVLLIDLSESTTSTHRRDLFDLWYVLKKGVDKKRMKYTGLKHLYPLGGDTKFDRRVEIEITYIKN